MTFSDWLGFFIGRRDAIQKIAAAPGALGLGLLFVLSAGLAREYDGEDLTREPWHVLIPIGASLATSFGLYCLVQLLNFAKSSDTHGFTRTGRCV